MCKTSLILDLYKREKITLEEAKILLGDDTEHLLSTKANRERLEESMRQDRISGGNAWDWTARIGPPYDYPIKVVPKVQYGSSNPDITFTGN